MAPNTIETLRLLVVSSEVSVLRLLGSTAQSNSWHLETSASGWDAMERVQSDTAPHLLLLDLPRGDGDGLHLLPWLRRLRPDLPIVRAVRSRGRGPAERSDAHGREGRVDSSGHARNRSNPWFTDTWDRRTIMGKRR